MLLPVSPTHTFWAEVLPKMKKMMSPQSMRSPYIGSIGVQNPVAIIISHWPITKDLHKFQCVGVVNNGLPSNLLVVLKQTIKDLKRLHMFSMDEAKKPPAYSITTSRGWISLSKIFPCRTQSID
jgi:hypothetical protein